MDAASPSEQLANLLDRINTLSRSPAFNEMIHLDLSISHFKALRHIARQGMTSMKDLAEALRLTPPSVTMLARKLEHTGMVERIRHANDSRVWLLRLTDAGQCLMDELHAQRMDKMQQLIDSLDSADQQQLLDLLGRAVTMVERLIAETGG